MAHDRHRANGLVMILVKLSAEERQLAALLSVQRLKTARRNRQRQRHSAGAHPNRRKAIDDLGSYGEVAASRATHRYLYVNQQGRRADLYPDVQVRARSRPDADLYLSDDACDTDPYVLVVAADPVDMDDFTPPSDYLVVGWIKAEDGKRPEWRHQSYGGWYVPQDALTPLPLPPAS